VVADFGWLLQLDISVGYELGVDLFGQVAAGAPTVEW
jgi:hypothetical protein